MRGYHSSDLARYCRLNEKKTWVRWVVGALHRGLSPSKRTQNKKCRTLFRLRRHERIACSAVFTLCTSCTMQSTYTRYRMYHCALCCFGESRVACRESCVVCRVSCFACPVSCVCVLVFGVVCALCVLGLCCRVLLWLRPPPPQGLFAGGPASSRVARRWVPCVRAVCSSFSQVVRGRARRLPPKVARSLLVAPVRAGP